MHSKRKTFTILSRKTIKKALQLSEMKNYSGEIKYLYQNINSISLPEICQSQIVGFCICFMRYAK